jgi:DNA-binding CsgD family transcriptional regulator
MWDLSPAELRLTGELMQGRTVTEAAARLDIAVSTARTQLKRVLAKVGVRRQVELVRAFLVGPAGMLGDKD